MTDDEIDPAKVDFSRESVEEATEFVLKCIREVIDAMEAETKWINELRDTESDNWGMVVIALANQYSGVAGFQGKWNLREKK